MLRMRSPGRRPARDAGLRSLTAPTTTPANSGAVVRADPQVSTALIRISLSEPSPAGAEAGRRIELLQALDDVLQAGRHREHRRRPREKLRKHLERTEVERHHRAQ